MSLFGGCKDGCNDSLLWFIILFILLFCTGMGKNDCCMSNHDDNDCGCNRLMR